MKSLFRVCVAIICCISASFLSGCTPGNWTEYPVEEIKPKPEKPEGGQDQGGQDQGGQDQGGQEQGGQGQGGQDQGGKDDGDQNPAQTLKSKSFILVGDVHYCEERFYDLPLMEVEKPSDYRQITQTYAPVTKANWVDQVKALKTQAEKTLPPVEGIIQLGDVSEGLGNFTGAPSMMAQNVVAKLAETNMPAPWILVKGNHDITGAGNNTNCKEEAKTAYVNYYTPFIIAQTGVKDIADATYCIEKDGILLVILDAYNSKQNQIDYLKNVLEKSKAEFKFVCMHEPAIPISEKCWHHYRTNPTDRAKFLKVIAENKAFFLAGHLHRYSVVRRNTDWGPIVQVMANSVTNVKRSESTATIECYEPGKYGDAIISGKNVTDATIIQYLKDEQPYVDYYKMNSLAGYGILTIDAEKKNAVVRYYSAFNTSEPFDEVDLTELYSKPIKN